MIFFLLKRREKKKKMRIFLIEELKKINLRSEKKTKLNISFVDSMNMNPKNPLLV